MSQVYREHMNMIQAESVSAIRERLPLRAPVDPHPGAIKRQATEHLENRFPRLPNPDLLMVVYPHLAAGKYPIPGYATVFPLYETVEYAMPGEVAPRRTRPVSMVAGDKPGQTGKGSASTRRPSAVPGADKAE